MLQRWRDTRSLRLRLRTNVKPDELNTLLKPRASSTVGFAPTPMRVPSATELVDIGYLHAHHFEYTTGAKKPPAFGGVGVAEYAAKRAAGEEVPVYLVATKPHKRLGRPPKNDTPRPTKERTARLAAAAADEANKPPVPLPSDGVLLNCGGPIAATAWCPRPATVDGDELLAVSTFTDEVDLMLPHDAADKTTFIQLWTIPAERDVAGTLMPTAERRARCRMLLEVRQATVLDLVWCPLLTADSSSSPPPPPSTSTITQPTRTPTQPPARAGTRSSTRIAATRTSARRASAPQTATPTTRRKTAAAVTSKIIKKEPVSASATRTIKVEPNECLGLLAASTSRGTILIYSVSEKTVQNSGLNIFIS